MNWVAMTIPDDPTRLAGWLEAQLVGQDLGRLVAELRSVHGDRPPAKSLDDILGPHAALVLVSGLDDLPNTAIRELLLNPTLLLDLQERVLLDGGPYWSELPMSEEFSNAVDRGWERLNQEKVSPNGPTVPVTTPSTLERRSFLRRVVPYAVTSLATAAAVLLALQALPRRHEVQTAKAWGWQKPDAFPQGLDRSSYLNRLAEEAGEWRNQRPTDVQSAAKRISEFRQGCTALLLADHTSLTPKDREWLSERCLKWSAGLDEILLKLEKTKDVDAAMKATDELEEKLSHALRERVKTAAT